MSWNDFTERYISGNRISPTVVLYSPAGTATGFYWTQWTADARF